MIYHNNVEIKYAEYTNVALTSVIIWLSITNNICKIISALSTTNLVNKYTKSHNYFIQLKNISEKNSEKEMSREEDTDTHKSIQVGLSSGMIILLFMLFLSIVCNANVKLTISAIFLTLIAITLQQFVNIYYLFELEMSKIFIFSEMSLFLILTIIILISLFNSMWICVYPSIFLVMYIVYVVKEGSLMEMEGLNIVLQYNVWHNKYSNVFDLINIAATIVLFVLLLTFAKDMKIWHVKNTNSLPTLTASASPTSIPINELFFFKDNIIQTTSTQEFTNSKYLLLVNSLNQVMLYTSNLTSGTIVGSYINNKITLNVSEYVSIGIRTGFAENMWFSDIIDSQIKFNDGVNIINGPEYNSMICVAFPRNSLHSFSINDIQIPMPCGEYELGSNFSTIAQPSSLNAVSIDIYNNFNNNLQIYEIYYPKTDILIGEGYFENFPCIWLNLNAKFNGQPIFQLINGNIMYLSPLNNQYVFIDSTYNLNLNNIFFKFT